MTTTHAPILRYVHWGDEPVGARLHRFTSEEYARLCELGILFEGDPTFLVAGRICIRLDDGPPYGVPLGIPPAAVVPADEQLVPQRRFSVEEYDQMLESGIFSPGQRNELVEGWVIDKMMRGSLHDGTLQRVSKTIGKRLGAKWEPRVQMAVIMEGAKLEPDLAIVPGPVDRFLLSHPRPNDVELLVEVADTTLALDRGVKAREYARNGIRRYWIVNIIARQVEVHTEPTGPTAEPKYCRRKIYRMGQSVEFVLGGRRLKPIPVSELIARA